MIPSPPELVEAIDNTKESVSLSWKPPKDCGRGKIFGYLVEFQKAGDEDWQKVNQTPDSCQETKFKVINLEDGSLYRFRVTAVNAAGESEAAYVKEPVRALDRLGKSFSLLYLYHYMGSFMVSVIIVFGIHLWSVCVKILIICRTPGAPA